MLRVILEDTLAPKKGPRVFGPGTHIDAIRSMKRHEVFCSGHCWVVLAVLVRVNFRSDLQRLRGGVVANTCLIVNTKFIAVTM